MISSFKMKKIQKTNACFAVIAKCANIKERRYNGVAYMPRVYKIEKNYNFLSFYKFNTCQVYIFMI